MKTRQSLLVAVPFVAIAAMSGAFLQRARAPEAPTPAAAIDAPAQAKADAHTARRAVVAEWRVYGVTFAQHVTIGGKKLANTRLEGRLSFLPLPGTSLVEAHFTEPRLESSGQESPTVADLTQPILLAHDAEGHFVGIRFAPGIKEPTRLVLTALVSSTQYTRGNGSSWSTEEHDGTGTYSAAYERDGADAVKRHKRGYLQMFEGLTPVSTEGDARFVLDGRNAIVSLTAKETSQAKGSAAFGEISGELSVAMQLVDRANASALDLSAARERASRYEAPQMAMPDDGDDGHKRRMDEQRAAGKKLSDLRAAFAATDGLPRQDGIGQKRAALINTAAALFRVRPEEALLAGKELASRDISGAEANFLAGGLAAAGTEEAAHALAGALTAADATDEARKQAAVSLAMMPVADADTVSALSKGASSEDPMLRNMCTMALGAQARALAANGGDGDADPVADLLAQYAEAPGDETRAMLLAALGNSGDVRAFEVIRQALEAPVLAPTATYALRFIAAPGVDALLHTLTAAPSPQVRNAAFRAAYYRDLQVWGPWLEAALQLEKDPHVLETIKAAIARVTPL